ncbi:TPA: glutamine synthetase [Pseudomonas putida]|uniref:glutamine synthetase n=1 Tax=Pseudomonas putida TaxID=303 RepID=UPI001576E008|nr:glutamine synthetase [Pseudomonas putida]MCC9007476.1 glutamine synthetase [Pseudomonas putida]NTY92077.1 glutamine synthetase [Pseudomonas putida]NTZ00293.1 glutamine synthetase [Pseudomonas putida]NTZ22872.1 glutamine synthetase [Pseudomonas putida]NTZ54653.1 glutamine synthetase [Pseudomonas putida]
MILLRAMVLLLLAMPTSLTAMPKNSPLAMCTRSATLLACQDGKGSYYSVRSEGNTFYLRGYDFSSQRLWAQTNSRYGTLTFFTGLASDGEAWVGYSRRVGWTTLNRVSSSSGQRFKLHCSLIGGCH